MRVAVTGGGAVRRWRDRPPAPRPRRRGRRPRPGSRRAGRRPTEPGLRLVADDLRDPAAISAAIDGADALDPRRGLVPDRDRRRPSVPAMDDANVGTAGADARCGDRGRHPAGSSTSRRSTSSANTNGAIVDETYRRDPRRRVPQLLRRDEVAGPRRGRSGGSADGAPAVIVMPSQVYGPGDHTPIGDPARAGVRGHAPVHRPRRRRDSEFVHVDDLAARRPRGARPGRRRPGYVLGGDQVRFRDALRIAARAGGLRLPRLDDPDRPAAHRRVPLPEPRRRGSGCRRTCARSSARRSA